MSAVADLVHNRKLLATFFRRSQLTPASYRDSTNPGVPPGCAVLAEPDRRFRQSKHKHGTDVTTKRCWRPLHCGPASTRPSRPPGAAGSSSRGCGTAIRQGMVLGSDDRRGGDRSVGADAVECVGGVVCGVDVGEVALGRRRRTRELANTVADIGSFAM